MSHFWELLGFSGYLPCIHEVYMLSTLFFFCSSVLLECFNQEPRKGEGNCFSSPMQQRDPRIQHRHQWMRPDPNPTLHKEINALLPQSNHTSPLVGIQLIALKVAKCKCYSLLWPLLLLYSTWINGVASRPLRLNTVPDVLEGAQPGV